MSLSCVQLHTDLFSWSRRDRWCFTSVFSLLLDHVAFDLTRTHRQSHTVWWSRKTGTYDSEQAGFKGDEEDVVKVGKRRYESRGYF